MRVIFRNGFVQVGILEVRLKPDLIIRLGRGCCCRLIRADIKLKVKKVDACVDIVKARSLFKEINGEVAAVW